VAGKPLTDRRWQDAKSHKPEEVPTQGIGRIHLDSMDAEDPVRQDTLEKVPEAKAQHGVAPQKAASPEVAQSVPPFSQSTQRDRYKYIHQCLKKPIVQDLQTHVIGGLHV
jgi:hypothetical protein